MFKWIGKHKTYTLLLAIVVGWFVYTGYVNVWEPAAIAADAKVAAGESVNFAKELIKFAAQEDVLDLLKSLLPILIPIFLYRRKANIDTNVRQKTNYVVREKMGIADRRKSETPEQRRKMQKIYGRRTVDDTKSVKKKPPIKVVRKK